MNTIARHTKGLYNPNIKQVLDITQIFNIVQKYLRPTRQLKLPASSRGLGLVQGLYYLVGHHGSFFQILTELFFSTISFGTLPKCIKTCAWPVRFHQLEYMTHLLTGGCGDIHFKGFGTLRSFPAKESGSSSFPSGISITSAISWAASLTSLSSTSFATSSPGILTRS